MLLMKAVKQYLISDLYGRCVSDYPKYLNAEKAYRAPSYVVCIKYKVIYSKNIMYHTYVQYVFIISTKIKAAACPKGLKAWVQHGRTSHQLHFRPIPSILPR